MLRRILFSGIAAGAILAITVWAVGRPAVVAQDASPADPAKKTGTPASARQAKEEKWSGERLLVQASPTAPLPAARTSERLGIAGDPIVIPNGRLKLIDLEDVPSQRDGVLMVIGVELKDGQQAPEHEIVQVQMGEVAKRFRRLKEGDYVQADQLLGLVDDTLARAEEAIKVAKVFSAEADKTAADKTRDEAMARYETQKKLYGSGRGSNLSYTSLEDLRGAQLTYTRYVYEAISKEQAIAVAKQELNQARKTLGMYEIRPKISGIVKTINRHRGEAVKSLEPVLQIQNYDRLRVEAWLQEQYANRLEKGMEAVIEPTLRDSPKQTFVGHRRDVTGVAVSKDAQKPLIVSCGDDGTVRVWERFSSEGRVRETRVLKHPAPVRAVACTPSGASANLCLSGDQDGKGRLWDLAERTGDKPLRELRGHHRGAITCVTFSPDGRTCATGGEDREIMVWDTATGSLRYQISGHRNMVTALHFAPGSRLISVSREPSVRFWKLGADRAEELDNEKIQRREAAVDQLGVSPDGQRVMDEHVGEMRVLSVPGAMTEAILRSTNFGKAFRNFALFSPDGRLALTTTDDGVLQLWRIDRTRSHELRQFVSPLRLAAKSAAFAPDGSFVVGAVKDRVYVWPMPGKDEVEQRITATIINVEKPIDLGEPQVRVAAELVNPGQRLRPGDVVTMVAYPQK